jgi:hypothetical protein
MSPLNWRTVTNERDSRFMVKGTELSRAIIPGFNSRFMLYDVRCYVWCDASQRNEADRTYCIRDAATVSDEQVRDGVRPAIVWRGESEEEAILWCKTQNSC